MVVLPKAFASLCAVRLFYLSAPVSKFAYCQIKKASSIAREGLVPKTGILMS
jgi:hypothetical protein